MEEGVLEAVESLKSGQFQATAIKVELEAELNRENENNIECDDCNGSGANVCEACGGRGVDPLTEDHCDHCDSEGEVECGTCSGSGQRTHGYWSVNDCEAYIMDQLTTAEKKTLSYHQFYVDGSVDSELTFTVKLDDPKNILILPKMVQIFKDLSDEIGGGLETKGAGMHMAVMNDPNAYYPSSSRNNDGRWDVFKRSLLPLMPALFFLGSPDGATRAMGYRIPGLSTQDKYRAIAFRGGAVEFRVFDTCYQVPNRILDNVVVMANAMKFWSRTPVPHKLSASGVFFGNDMCQLQKLYVTERHIDLLNKGLHVLKPSYYKVTDIKKQRNFKLTKTILKAENKKRESEAEIAYREYEQRHEIRLKAAEHYYQYEQLEQLAKRGKVEDLPAKSILEKEAKKRAKSLTPKKTLADHVKEQREKFTKQTACYALN